jgi:hypothetical protein
MATLLRSTLAIVCGLALAMILIVGVEVGSSVLHPFPSEFKGTPEEICRHVERYPGWILTLVVVAWGGTTFASTWVATRMGSRIPGIVVGLILLSAVACNMFHLPYPMWFEILNLLIFPLAILLGIRTGRRAPTGLPTNTSNE